MGIKLAKKGNNGSVLNRVFNVSLFRKVLLKKDFKEARYHSVDI